MTQEEMQRMFNEKLNGSMFGFGGMQPQLKRTWTIKQWVGDALVRNQTANMDDDTARYNLENIARQISSESAPMKVRFSFIYYKSTGEEENYAEWTNKAWDNSH